MIELGEVVRDKITGFQGVATARWEEMEGSKKILVESRIQPNEKPVEVWINECRLEVFGEA